MRVHIFLITLITLIIGCNDQPTNTEEELKIDGISLTAVESEEAFIERGNNIADDLDKWLNFLDAETGAAPTISVRYDPYVIYYDSKNNEVVAPMYDMIPDETKEFFITWGQESDLAGAEFYEKFFKVFFYIHEFGHWTQYQLDGLLINDRYYSEMEANEITIAYLEYFDEGRQFLDYISPKVDSLVSYLDNPVPEGVSEKDYFNDNYNDLALDADAYGYFQFKFVQNALLNRGEITMEEVVSRRD